MSTRTVLPPFLGPRLALESVPIHEILPEKSGQPEKDEPRSRDADDERDGTSHGLKWSDMGRKAHICRYYDGIQRCPWGEKRTKDAV